MSAVEQTGHILVAAVGGLDVLNASHGDRIKSLKFGNKCITVESHEDVVMILSMNENGKKMTFVTLDLDYNEIDRFTTSFGGCDFTKIDNKIYVTTGSSRLSRDIEIFSAAGERLSSFMWNGNIVGITGIPPNSIVFGDIDQHRVYKRRMEHGVENFEWTADVKAPRCLCIDDNGLIWIWSNANNCLTILNRDGK